MAKPDVSQADPTVISRAVLELKKELQRLVKAIVDDDDCSLQTIDQAQQKLSAMKDLKVKKSLSLKIDATLAAPEEFLCPLSKEVMRDPVILASGQVRATEFLFFVYFLNLFLGSLSVKVRHVLSGAVILLFLL